MPCFLRIYAHGGTSSSYQGTLMPYPQQSHGFVRPCCTSEGWHWQIIRWTGSLYFTTFHEEMLKLISVSLNERLARKEKKYLDRGQQLCQESKRRRLFIFSEPWITILHTWNHFRYMNHRYLTSLDFLKANMKTMPQCIRMWWKSLKGRTIILIHRLPDGKKQWKLNFIRIIVFWPWHLYNMIKEKRSQKEYYKM